MTKNSWRFILFDFDGVLFDSRQAAITFVDELRDQAPFRDLPSPSKQNHFGELYRGILRDALLQFGLDASASQDFFDQHATHMRDIADSLDLFDGVAEAIAALDQDSFAIVTSSYKATVQGAFRRAGVELDPETIIGHEVRATKTDKIMTALKNHDAAPSAAVYVGDMESDIIYCRNVPIRCIAASYGYHPESILMAANPLDVCSTPDHLFKTLNEGLLDESTTSN